MYEHLVKKVREIPNDPEGFIHLQYQRYDRDVTENMLVAPVSIGAIETWLAHPKPPTPEERGIQVVNDLCRRGAMRSELEDLEAVQRIADAIREAIEADRAARGET